MKYEIKIKKLPKSEVELEASLSADLLADARKKALQMFCTSLDISGFRPGHVPENIVLEKVGEDAVLEEAVDILLKKHFPKIIDQEKLDIIGQPKISITKLAIENPVEFKAIFAVMPEFELPDYKKIAASSQQLVASKKKKEDTEVSEEEINAVLLQIRKNKAHFDYHEKNKDEKDHEHSGLDLENPENLPALNDELAKAAGNFKNLDELKEKIKENIINEKKIRNTEKARAEMMEALVKKTEIDLPNILVEKETEKSLAQMKDDIARMGMKWEDYLSHTKKSEGELKKDLVKSSENKAKIQLIFNKIAEIEKIEPDKTILENEVKEVMEHYPEASELNARIYVSTILTNSAVLKLLENQ